MRIALIIAAVGSLVFTAAPASAAASHAFTTTFGAASSNPPDPYPLSGPTDIDIDQASHDFYVTDPGNHRVEKFDSAGNFILMFGKGVNKTAIENSRTAEANVCPAAGHPGDICQAGTSSSSAGAFETPAYLAVDNSGGPSTGDIYIGDTGSNVVQKFNSLGELITSWGPGGQKDGSDALDLPGFGPLFGVAVGGPNGDLFVGGTHYADNVWEYTPEGTYEGPYQGVCGTPWLKADSAGDLFFTGTSVLCFYGSPVVTEAVPIPGSHEHKYYVMGTASPVTGFALDPAGNELYQDTGTAIEHYSADCNPPAGPCEPVDSFGSGQLSGAAGVGVDGTSHTVYVANSTSNDVAVFSDVRPIVTTGSPSGATETEVTINGHIDPAGRGDVTSCHFEYGFDKTYGTVLPCTPDPASANFTGPTDVKATITGLSPGTKDHYRLVATNAAGATAYGTDETLITTQPPAIDGLASANLTPTSADLNAQVNPNGLETTYRFEYGPTTGYGQSAPVPDGTIGAANTDQSIESHLENLVPHDVYHYRLVTTNADGTTTSEDQTFNFYPPTCPNENVRQQTQTNYLPDCRAYELVSPSDAGGTQLFADGPNTGYATNPSRFSYTGEYATIPGSGGSPIDGFAGDLYVATRTDTGWESKYVGLPSDEAAVDGGPPLGPPNSTPAQEFRSPSALPAASGVGPASQNSDLTDPSMEKFLDFNDGNQSIESIFGSDFQNPNVIASNAAYVWGADGSRLDRWPTNLGSVPSGVYPTSSGASTGTGQLLQTAPGGSHALDCPYVQGNADDCPGDVTTSGDLSHFVFATEWNAFAPGGQLTAPGSVYDNDTAAGTVAVASKTPAGENIPSEPTDLAGDPLQIPAVSKDGSHILMAAGGTGPCGSATCAAMPCDADYSMVRRCLMQPSHLYMRVDDAVTYDVSQGHDVNYVGMSGDGSKVYFTSAQPLTPDDTDTSVDLYMWSESTNSLTRISAGNNGAGNSDACNVDFVSKCGVSTYTELFYCQLGSSPGGNCLSDNFIASENGDIYFFSPEQLDGTRGLPNQENLYDYRNGQAQYVTTFTGSPLCFETYSSNTCTRVERMQVTPDDSHMAFITSNQITQYNNAGHQEMYTYEPSTRKLVCVSCLPSGAPPTSDVEASQDGLFLTNDGRAFFSTEDALVHADTNQAIDVYEYVNGRPQLITAGTGDTTKPSAIGFGAGSEPGLVGVSADGRDVFFATFDSLVPQDHNGLFTKFYDARADGGFPAPPPAPPCSAADECHGPGSEPSAALQNGTGATLGTAGNVSSAAGSKGHKAKKHQKRAHRRAHKRAHARAAGRGGSR